MLLASNKYRAIRIGKLANPNLIKGKGLGITYSIVDKKRHNAPKKAISLDFSLFMKVQIFP